MTAWGADSRPLIQYLIIKDPAQVMNVYNEAASSQVKSTKRQPAYNTQVVLDFYAGFGIILVPEHKFLQDRDFRFDFAHLPTKVALEIQGAVWKGSKGGHTSGSGYVRDMEKSNLAVSNGWRIVQCVPQDICMNETVNVFKQTMEVHLK